MTTEATEPQAPASSLRTHSLRRRVVGLVLLLLIGLLVLLAITADLILHERLRGQLEQRLNDKAAVAAALSDQVGADVLVRRLEGGNVSVRLDTADGDVVRSGPLANKELPTDTSPEGDAPPPPGGQKPAGPEPVGSGDVPVRPGQTLPLQQSGKLLQVTRTLDDGSVITLTASTTDIDKTMQQVRLAFAVGSLAVLVAAAGLLIPVVGRALRPLETMTVTARAISAGDRGRRLNPDNPNTELGRTATAFDDMLDSVEGAERHARAAEHRLREFISDAAHELRTPLTGIQAAAEHLLRANPERRDRERLTVTVIREARRAARLMNDMLTMARIDAGLPLQKTEIDLRQLAETVALPRRVQGKSAVNVAGDPAPVLADPDRITQVLNNVVDNALRAAGDSGDVSIVTTAHPVPTLDIRDSGPGVPAGSEELIFERLARLDDARDRDRGGAGLGLPIARGLARAHGGDLICVPSDSGGHFRLILPCA